VLLFSVNVEISIQTQVKHTPHAPTHTQAGVPKMM